MRTLVLIALALMGCATEPAPAPSLKSGEQPPQAPQPIIIGESRTIASKALGEDRTLNVYLPPSYAAGDAKYPVVWLIDGGVAQDFPHIAGLAQYGALSGMFREAIIVGVETRERQREPGEQGRQQGACCAHGRRGASWASRGRSSRASTSLVSGPTCL